MSAQTTDPRPALASVGYGRGWSRGLTVLVWAYLVGVLAVWALIRWAGDRWWPATMLMLGPRWILAAPAVPLAAAAAVPRRGRWGRLAVIAVAATVAAGPLMGLCVPWRRWADGYDGHGQTLRVLTCNVHEANHGFDSRAWADLITTAKPDVVALQEWGRASGGPAVSAGAGGRWYVVGDGELRIESRFPVRRAGAVFTSPGWSAGAAAAYDVQTPARTVRLIVVHLTSPHDAIRAAVRLRAAGEARLGSNNRDRGEQAADVGDAAEAAGTGVILAGDFNLPCDSRVYRRELGGLADAFSVAGWGYGWTYFNRGTAVRIDHVLTGQEWTCRSCWVGPNVGSPHRPLIADLLPR